MRFNAERNDLKMQHDLQFLFYAGKMSSLKTKRLCLWRRSVTSEVIHGSGFQRVFRSSGSAAGSQGGHLSVRAALNVE